MILIFLFLISGSAWSQIHMANEMAKKDTNLFSLGYSSVSTTGENTANETSFESNQSTYRFLFEYGVSHHNSIGVYTTKIFSENKEDFGDISLFLKGYDNGLLYQLTGHISPERSGDENADSGGEHLTLIIGYEFNKYFGINASYSPDYTYRITDLEDKTKYRRGSAQVLSAHIELPYNANHYGLEVSYSKTQSPTEDGQPVSEDSKYSIGKIYSNFQFGKYGLMPTLIYQNYLGDDSAVEISSTVLSVILKKEFSFPSFWN